MVIHKIAKIYMLYAAGKIKEKGAKSPKESFKNQI